MEDNEKAIVKKATAVERFNPDDPVSLYMNTSVFEQLQRVSKLMAHSALVPKHLQGDDKTADCFLVAAQAFRWRMDPFAVAQCSFVLSGKLGYEGKLIAAVVNASPRLATSLNYEYSGTGANREVRVYATLKGEDKPREVRGTIAQWRTQNRQWETMPDQMLSYRGAREWSRRHMPEAVLGVYSDDEIEVMATQPHSSTVSVESLEAFTEPTTVTVTNDPPKVVKPAPEVIPVEAEVIPPPAKAPKPKKEEKKVEAPKADLDPEDAALDSLF